ncbi:Uncharacterised protein [Streptococcus pneumoniae]|nr:Uncharacterised protein [Streptococcus pneumoniae]CWK86054.1 Uncharacterised protein [Streptococcus pneumoniae]
MVFRFGVNNWGFFLFIISPDLFNIAVILYILFFIHDILLLILS